GINEPYFHLATPIYHLKYRDGYHLFPESYKLYGHYLGRALSQVIKGEDYEPLHPTSHTVSGNDVLLKFNKTGLVFEKPEYLVAAITNKGFNLKNAGIDIITSVTIE